MNQYSPTKLNQYLRCPQQFEYRYIRGLKIPPSSSMAQGLSFHGTEEYNFQQKIESHEDIKSNHLKEYYASYLDTKLNEGVEWNEEEKSEGIEKVKGGLLDEGVKLVDAAARDLNPKINPIKVEEAFTIEIKTEEKDPIEITGRIDLISKDGDIERIHELKTTARTPSEISFDHQLQGIVYSMATETKEVEFNYAVKNKTPKIVSLSKQVDATDIEGFVTLTHKVDHAIRAGSFYPNRGSFMCSKKWCGYWAQCEKENGGKIKD